MLEKLITGALGLCILVALVACVFLIVLGCILLLNEAVDDLT